MRTLALIPILLLAGCVRVVVVRVNHTVDVNALDNKVTAEVSP